MQPQLIEELRSRLRELELDKYEARLLPHARLAFDLILDDESEGEIGESRWGGAPDVPADFEWPYRRNIPLTFLAQINLSDLIQDLENPFPASGLLQFFADFEGVNCHVVLLELDTTFSPATIPEGIVHGFAGSPAHCLCIEPCADLPGIGLSDSDELVKGFTQSDEIAYDQLWEGFSDAGKLLGYASGICRDPREDAFDHYERESSSGLKRENPQYQKGIRRWKNLLRFDSVIELLIGDAGYFTFLIHEDDLKNLDFSRVYAGLESS